MNEKQNKTKHQKKTKIGDNSGEVMGYKRVFSLDIKASTDLPCLCSGASGHSFEKALSPSVFGSKSVTKIVPVRRSKLTRRIVFGEKKKRVG